MYRTTQKQLFKYVWDSRPHFCCICKKNILDPAARCFAHILGKGMHPAYELFYNNIVLVCGPKCHKEVDRRVSGSKYEIEQIIKMGDFIDINGYNGKSK